ncbi:MAG: nitroreductase family protein [Bacillota bacterium]|nr:nitroreductase family protein [Bacillota bacterium]
MKRIEKEVYKRNRSYRIFDEKVKIDDDTLVDLIDLARYSSSRGNRQPLKYIICNNDYINENIFKNLHWAKKIKNWPGPENGEKPTAYIIVLGDTEISNQLLIDTGLACQNILKGAVEIGYGGCMINNIDRVKIRELLNIEEKFEIMLVIALGKPKQVSYIESMSSKENIDYWFDNENNVHVPKRAIEDIITKHIRRNSNE